MIDDDGDVTSSSCRVYDDASACGSGIACSSDAFGRSDSDCGSGSCLTLTRWHCHPTPLTANPTAIAKEIGYDDHLRCPRAYACDSSFCFGSDRADGGDCVCASCDAASSAFDPDCPSCVTNQTPKGSVIRSGNVILISTWIVIGLICPRPVWPSDHRRVSDLHHRGPDGCDHHHHHPHHHRTHAGAHPVMDHK